MSDDNVRLGGFGEANCLWGRVITQDGMVLYEVNAIIALAKDQLGSDPTIASGEVHSENSRMLRFAAETAKRMGQSTFLYIGRQANTNFRIHADRKAEKYGFPFSGAEYGAGGGGGAGKASGGGGGAGKASGGGGGAGKASGGGGGAGKLPNGMYADYAVTLLVAKVLAT